MRWGSTWRVAPAAVFLPPVRRRGRVQISDFNFFHFGIEVHALFRDEDGFLPTGAVMEQVLG